MCVVVCWDGMFRHHRSRPVPGTVLAGRQPRNYASQVLIRKRAKDEKAAVARSSEDYADRMSDFW